MVQKRDGPQSLNEKPKKGSETAQMTHSTFVGGQEQQSTAQTRSQSHSTALAYSQQHSFAKPLSGSFGQQQDFTNIGNLPGNGSSSQIAGSGGGRASQRAGSYQMPSNHVSNVSGGTSAAHQYSAYHRSSNNPSSSSGQPIYPSSGLQHSQALSAQDL